MRYIDLNKPKKVFFSGIGGISMSGFALLLSKEGFDVSGSDRSESDVTRSLEAAGIKVILTQTADNITDDIDVLVHTAAVKADSPELIRAKELGIPVIDRASLVGDIMLSYKNNYAVAGSHGKTSSTSMMILVLLEAGLDPTVNLGGILSEIGGNTRLGNSDTFCIEACEYTDSFLKFHPTRAIITNIEPEHLDYFGDFDNEKRSFSRFAELIPSDGLLAVGACIKERTEIFKNISCRMITFAGELSDSVCNIAQSSDTSKASPASAATFETSLPDYHAEAVSYNSSGCGSYTLYKGTSPIGMIELGVPGAHNITNSVGVAALALESGIPFEAIKSGLFRYRGTHRRFEKKGEIGGVTIIDDYAHHPTEMEATIKTAKSLSPKRLVIIFQSHTYSRTAMFKEEMCKALSGADLIVITDFYAAREVNTFGITPGDLVKILKEKYGKEAYHFPSFGEIEDFCLENCSTGDMLITMGAGDVDIIADHLLGH
ncbi:MAG: UDP-N-acetylmuramate--L-alanine ligase [Lachnospiraceae bacterium]|nr:UDP-N-acetylmuramate--L-alanine ligase [Lachnospiraceae bacterium]